MKLNNEIKTEYESYISKEIDRLRLLYKAYKVVMQACESPLEQKFIFEFIKTYKPNIQPNIPNCLYFMVNSEFGISIQPQVNYKLPSGKHIRIDVVMNLFKLEDENPYAVAIEIDGHEFHEKSKSQAQKDKSRDRELQQDDIPAFRFTGSEVFADAHKCVIEVVDYLLGRTGIF